MNVWHSWVEVLYPGVGWVEIDPQTSEFGNFHIVGGFSQCEKPETTLSVLGYSLWSQAYRIYFPFFSGEP